MHWYRSTKQLKQQVPLVLPWYIPVVTYLLLGPAYVSHWSTLAGATLINFGIGLAGQFLLDVVTKRIIDRYFDLRQTGLRVSLLMLSYMVITTAFIVATMWGYEHGHWFGYEYQPGTATRILLFNVVVNLISVGVFESSYSMRMWRTSVVEKEQLKKINLQSQYESLKNQVNPHFLFNTLNSLSSLIADEPERAEEFVDEMAKVYRYLLQTNRQTDDTGELTTLATEMAFIQSYFHLLKTRYGSGIQLDVTIDEADLTSLLPPLTLQMLVENAVKHNVIHANKPLIIEIKSAPTGRLLVQNNLQRKTTRVLSNQVGLNNIIAKYRLLAQQRPGLVPATTDITVAETDFYFTVSLSLINPNPS
ncbi:sensor histidine kinase [Spirosoma humi]